MQRISALKVLGACGFALASVLAGICLGDGGDAGAEQGPPATTVRSCGSRGEPSASPRPDDLVLGPTRFRLDGFAGSKPSVFASRADQVGFKRYIDGPRGRALPAAKRERLRRLAKVYFSQLKTPVTVAAGHIVSLAIARADRPYAAFMFVSASGRRGRQIGPYYSYRVSDGTPAVRFHACRSDEPRFSGPGTVGPYTSFPGGMVVAGARC